MYLIESVSKESIFERVTDYLFLSVEEKRLYLIKKGIYDAWYNDNQFEERRKMFNRLCLVAFIITMITLVGAISGWKLLIFAELSVIGLYIKSDLHEKPWRDSGNQKIIKTKGIIIEPTNNELKSICERYEYKYKHSIPLRLIIIGLFIVSLFVFAFVKSGIELFMFFVSPILMMMVYRFCYCSVVEYKTINTVLKTMMNMAVSNNKNK